MNKSLIEEQKEICKKYGAEFLESPEFLKIGISKNALTGEFPIHALRHPPEGDTSGWYVWTGEYSEADDFFVPMHIVHLKENYMWIMKYLGLGPGWRFLVTKEYEDVWYDENLFKNLGFE